MNGKTATAKPAQGVEIAKESGALTVVKSSNVKTEETPQPKKKLSIQEKIDALHKMEALSSKLEYLRERKSEIEKFGTGLNGFQGAKLYLEAEGCEDVKVSNPLIVQELLGIASVRLTELLQKAEKEFEAYEII